MDLSFSVKHVTPFEVFDRYPMPEELHDAVVGNKFFRHVLYTAPDRRNQIVAMSVTTRIAQEVHEETDQMIVVEAGTGTAIVDGRSEPIRAGSVIMVGRGSQHEFIATGKHPLQVTSFYFPAHHPEGHIDVDAPE